MPPAVKKKEESKPEAPKEEPKGKTISLQVPTISLSLDPGVKAKLPLLFLILLFFAFSAFLFEKANFHSVDVVDFARLQYNISKLYSITFLLFIVLFSLDIALSVHFGFGLNRLTSLLVLPTTLLPALVLGLVFPKMMLVFIAFSLTATFAAFFASSQKELTLSTAWSTVGKTMLLFVVLAFFITYLKFSANPSFYAEKMFESTLGLVPDIGKQISGTIQSFEVNEALLSSVVTKEAFQKAISPEQVQSAIEKIPGITSFNASLRQKWAEVVRDQLTSDEGYNAFIKAAVSAIKDLKTALAQQIEAQTASPDKDVAKLAIAQAKSFPQFKAVLDNFAWVAAFAVLSLLSVLNFFIKLLGTLFVWLLKKIALS